MKKAMVSNEELEYLKKHKKRRIVSFFPVDKHDCDCFSHRQGWVKKLRNMPVEQRKRLQEEAKVFHCPRREKKGMKKYGLYCGHCGDLLAEVYALDDELNGWCDLHYVIESRLVNVKRSKTVLDTYERDYKSHKKGDVKRDKKGNPKTKKISWDVKGGVWHGATAVNVEKMSKPVVECSCGHRCGFAIIEPVSSCKYKVEKIK